MRPLLYIFSLMLSVSASAQPAQTLKLTQLETSPDSSLREGYAGVTDTNGRQRYQNYPRINLTCLTYTPPATGNLPFYYSTYVTKCSTDSTWYIDWTGRAFFLGYNGPVSGGGIYGGSGIIPASTTSAAPNGWVVDNNGASVVTIGDVDGDFRSIVSEVGETYALMGTFDPSKGYFLYNSEDEFVEMYLNGNFHNAYNTGLFTNIAATATGGWIVEDDRAAPSGMRYGADYSAGFTARSIVDKAYVDAVAGGGGSVTSVGLSLPTSVFDISGSPVTGAGTLTGTFDNQSANTFFAGPTSGGAATPGFRAIVAADVPLNFIDSTHIKSKGVAFTNLGPTAGITVNQGPVWSTTLSKFIAKTLLTSETMGSNNLSGLLTNPTVVAIQDVSVASTAPTNAQVLQYNSGATEWQPTTLSITNAQLAANSVDSTKVANGALSMDDLGQRGASTGQAIAWNGSAWRPTAVPSATTTHEYTTAQTNTSLAVPAAAKTALVTVVGAGGGGGSGRKGAAGSVRCGGGGGASGGVVHVAYPLDGSISTFYINVGTGGAGGASRTASNSNGLGGSDGGNSDVRTTTSATDIIVLAGGGESGNGGTTSAAAGGGTNTPSDATPASGGPSNASGGSGGLGTSSNTRCGGGGGAGGGITSANAANAGGTGGSGYLGLQAGGAPPSSISLSRESGGGGDGGAASTSGNATAGSDGVRGGGGGGGGASVNSVGDSGAGGAGGVGYVKVIFIF